MVDVDWIVTEVHSGGYGRHQCNSPPGCLPGVIDSCLETAVFIDWLRGLESCSVFVNYETPANIGGDVTVV